MKRKIVWIVMTAGLLLLVSCKPEHTTGWITPTVSANTPTPIVVPTCTPEVTPTPDEVTVPTISPTATTTPSPSLTATATPSPSPLPSPTPTETPSPSLTATATPSPSPLPSPTPTETPSPTATATPSPSPLPSPTPTETPSPTATATPSPSPLPSPTPTETPSPTPTATPSLTPTMSPSPTPTEAPSPTPTETPSPTATLTPSPTPTMNPEELVPGGWQKAISIDERYIIIFPDLFRESAVTKENTILRVRYTCEEDTGIEFQIIYSMQQTLEEVVSETLAKNGVLLEDTAVAEAVSYSLQENGKTYRGILLEEQYPQYLLGSIFGEEEWITGVMQVVFSYPEDQTEKYEAEQYRYYVVENREE